MITSELISYIRKQINKNTSKDLIISKLTQVGWRKEDIDEGFLNIERESKPIIEIKKDEPKIEIFNKEIPPKVEVLRTETPKAEIPKKEETKINIPPIQNLKTGLEVFNTELSKGEIPKREPPKMWTPMNVPVIEKAEPLIPVFEKTKPTTSIIEETEPVIPIIETTKKEIPIVKLKEEIFPTPTPTPTPTQDHVVNSFGLSQKNNFIENEGRIIPQNETPKGPLSSNLPKVAMLSSYPSDLSSFDKTGVGKEKRKKRKILRWIILPLIVVAIIFGIWAFSTGHINIKKDPKILLLNNSTTLSSLNSYKTETNIEISSPSFINITSGLITGEAISSLEKDSISIKTLGLINKTGEKVVSDNLITIKGSVLPDIITTDVKNDGSDLFIVASDFSQIIKEKIPESTVVKTNEQQFDLIPSLFSPDIESDLKKVNMYQILSNGISSYINKETLGVYNEFINNVKITEKGQENIKGIDTYHYLINTDKQLSKKLLINISNNFTSNLSTLDKDNLAQIIGSVTVDSFEVWVGKGDNNIYQYNVILSIPLSKIVGFDDKSIGDNQVHLNWKTTYYDFNVVNNISIPGESISASIFVKNIKETRMKNKILSFKQLATDLHDIEKNYGSKSNSSGSCMNPNSGSLFSPVGHTEDSTTAISSISKLLNEILNITNNAGSCYSTPKAWSFTIPIYDNYDLSSIPTPESNSFFCIDDTGISKELMTPPTGVVCK